MKITSICASLLLTGLMSVQALAAAPEPSQDALAQAVKSDFRQAKNSLRDEYRHPQDTLNFFGINSSQTVIELWPGAGWYAEILGPYLAKDGHYVAANFETEPSQDTQGNRYRAKNGKKFAAWLAQHSDVLGAASTVTLDPPAKLTLGADKSADLVLTFRNLHNWAMQDQLAGIFDAAFRVLKDGGVFGVVEHRAKPGMDPDSGYMVPEQVIALATKAGFVLAASSEVNANPKDSKDYSRGVWTLPPVLALGQQDRDKYLAIGESDRMTLKFIKKSS
ncbi:methyltransferase [Shewanella sp. AS16]|uniref:class I SAM-dependent methyltransferase n=1 Tax=Shewanella sp. AS16 TaxID=2907625 RepID=UPI001F1CF65B|nr:methyltransferase [Shewanella sp. AS16]MCE9684692.1 methyltransferase [Shewanella sp. AS16]